MSALFFCLEDELERSAAADVGGVPPTVCTRKRKNYTPRLSSFPKVETMKSAIFAALVGSAAAFAPEGATKASTSLNGAMEDLKEVAEKSNPVLKVSRNTCLPIFSGFLFGRNAAVEARRCDLFVDESRD